MISGFSKLNRYDKVSLLPKELDYDVFEELRYEKRIQAVLDDFSENTLSNFPLPFSLAPNFMIDGQDYFVPMVSEESSVVAAASKAAKFWKERGGFKTTLVDDIKVGHVHFLYEGDEFELAAIWNDLREIILSKLK